MSGWGGGLASADVASLNMWRSRVGKENRTRRTHILAAYPQEQAEDILMPYKPQITREEAARLNIEALHRSASTPVLSRHPRLQENATCGTPLCRRTPQSQVSGAPSRGTGGASLRRLPCEAVSSVDVRVPRRSVVGTPSSSVTRTSCSLSVLRQEVESAVQKEVRKIVGPLQAELQGEKEARQRLETALQEVGMSAPSELGASAPGR